MDLKLWFPQYVSDPGVDDRLVVWARTRFAAGDSANDVLDGLRRRGLDPTGCIDVLHVAARMSRAEAFQAVHASPVWADQRQVTEDLTDVFFRSGFIECVLGGGTVNSPPEDVEEWRDRQQRAVEQLQRAAAACADHEPDQFRTLLTDRRFGRAFASLVDLGHQSEMPVPWWRLMAAVAQTLCLDELLNGESSIDEIDEVDEVRAARLVYRMAGDSYGREDQ